MSTRRQWLLILLLAGSGAIAGYWLKPGAKNCQALTKQAVISKLSAEICTGQLVGCGMSYDQVRQVVAEQVAAEECK